MLVPLNDVLWARVLGGGAVLTKPEFVVLDPQGTGRESCTREAVVFRRLAWCWTFSHVKARGEEKDKLKLWFSLLVVEFLYI